MPRTRSTLALTRWEGNLSAGRPFSAGPNVSTLKSMEPIASKDWFCSSRARYSGIDANGLDSLSPGGLVRMRTRRSMFGNGGSSNVALNKPKMAVLAPMPTAIISTTAAAMPLRWRICRKAEARSSRSDCIETPCLHGQRFVHDAAVKEMNRALGMGGVSGVVRHHADRGPGAMEFSEQVHDRLAVL